MDDYPTTNGTSQAWTTPIQTSSLSESRVDESQLGSVQVRRISSQAFLQAIEQPGQSGDVTEHAEVADPSGQKHVSARARGKQREIRSDGIDELDSGLAWIDSDGKTWTPIK